MKYRLSIHHDDMAESPEYDTFEVISFNRYHGSFRDPNEVFDELEDEFDEGFAFFLSYFEHGLCRWSLKADGVDPMLAGDWRWDGVNTAGIVRMSSADSGTIAWWQSLDMDERRKVLRQFLESYTDWANGNCWGFTWQRLEECSHGDLHVVEDLDSIWGYVGSDILWGIREYAPADATEDNTEVVDEYGATAYADIWEKASA